MNIQEIIKSLREKTERIHDPDEYVAVWSEYEPYKNRREKAFVIILKTRGCFWFKHSGCSMCGYYKDTDPGDVNDSNIMNQIEKAVKKIKDEKIIKIFNSGSFFDPNEISENTQMKILELFSGMERVIVETRPEFVTYERMSRFKKFENLMVAIGLESSSDDVLKYSINKGFSSSEYVRAAKVLNDLSIPLKTYILLKPPFLTEREAIEDAIKSIEFAAGYSELISINPVDVQSYTLVEYLWNKGFYRPPWLWSLVEVLRRTAKYKKVVSFPTAGSKIRGIHNCGKCDNIILKIIEEFSFTQDEKILEELPKCECKLQWENIIKNENKIISTFGDEKSILNLDLELGLFFH